MKPKPVFVCLIGTMSTFAFVMTSPKGGDVASSSSSTTRCFCNEVGCVRTGYMCKSALNLCYSVVILAADGAGQRVRSVHGCADTQPETSRSACAAAGNDRHAASDAAPAAAAAAAAALSSMNGSERRLLCCSHDMCNYIDGTGAVVLSAVVTNGSSAAAADDTSSSNNFDGEQHPGAAAAVVFHGGALWFRVAVIVVPLVGLFLLILLVSAAVRMLRGDHLLLRHRHRRRRHIVVSIDDGKSPWRPSSCGATNRVVGGLCVNHHAYPTPTPTPTTTCWLEFSDDNNYYGHCCDVRTVERLYDRHRRCVRVSDCATGIHGFHAPLDASYSRRIQAKTPPPAATSPSGQERVPFAAAV